MKIVFAIVLISCCVVFSGCTKSTGVSLTIFKDNQEQLDFLDSLKQPVKLFSSMREGNSGFLSIVLEDGDGKHYLVRNRLWSDSIAVTYKVGDTILPMEQNKNE